MIQDFKMEYSDSLKQLIVAIEQKYQCRFIDADADLTELLNMTSTGGIKESTAAIVLNSFTFARRRNYFELRKYIIDNRNAKAIVQLPPGLLGKTMVTCTMVLLDAECDHIRFVDASESVTKDGRHWYLSDENIREIVEMIEADSTRSSRVSYENLKDTSLSVNDYIKPYQTIQNGITLEEASKSIICGVQINPDELKRTTTEDETEWRYVTVGNLSNSAVDVVLPHFTEINDSYLSHVVHGTSLIISSIGKKMGMMVVSEDQTVIAVGRLFVFELDTDKVDPDGVLKYLASTEGRNAIGRCAAYGSVGSMRLDWLKNIIIPKKVFKE